MKICSGRRIFFSSRIAARCQSARDFTKGLKKKNPPSQNFVNFQIFINNFIFNSDCQTLTQERNYKIPKAVLRTQLRLQRPGALAIARENKKKTHIKIDKIVTSTMASPATPKFDSYSRFLSDEVYKGTVKVWNLDTIEGKNSKYPSPIALATSAGSFGRPSLDHSFVREPSFENIVIFMFRSLYLAVADYPALLYSSGLFRLL